MKSECVWRWQCRTWRAISSCSLHHTFGVIPSCPLLQGSKCCNKPWMNKVLFFNMYAIKFEWMAARVFPMAICILDGCKMTCEDQNSRGVDVPTYEHCAQAIVQQRAPQQKAYNAGAHNGARLFFFSCHHLFYDKIVKTFSRKIQLKENLKHLDMMYFGHLTKQWNTFCGIKKSVIHTELQGHATLMVILHWTGELKSSAYSFRWCFQERYLSEIMTTIVWKIKHLFTIKCPVILQQAIAYRCR